MERSYDNNGTLFEHNGLTVVSTCAWKYFVVCGLTAVLLCIYIFILLSHVIFMVVHEVKGSWVKFRKQGEIVQGTIVKRHDEMDSFVSNYTTITVECNIHGFTSCRQFKYPWRYGRYHAIRDVVECIHIPGQSPTSWRRTQDVGNIQSLCMIFKYLMVVILTGMLVLALPLVLYHVFDCNWTLLALTGGLTPVVLATSIIVPRLSSWISRLEHEIQFARPVTGYVAGGEVETNDYAEEQDLVEDDLDSMMN